MRAGCHQHTCSVKGFRGLGVERMVKRDIVTSVSCCCRACKGQRQCQAVENLTPYIHAPGRGIRELDSMRVEYSEPLAAWIFPRQGTHGLYAVHGVDGCARTRFCLFLKNISYTLEKARLRQQKNSEQHRQAAQRPPQSGVHTAQHTSQTVARNPAACIYFIACRGMRFTHGAVVSKAYVKKCTMVT